MLMVTAVDVNSVLVSFQGTVFNYYAVAAVYMQCISLSLATDTSLVAEISYKT